MKWWKVPARLLVLALLIGLFPMRALAGGEEPLLYDPVGTAVVDEGSVEEPVPEEEPSPLEVVSAESETPADAPEPEQSAAAEPEQSVTDGEEDQQLTFDPDGVNLLGGPLMALASTAWNNETVTLTESQTIGDRITVTGSVTLDLNGYTLTANRGITVPGGASLTIRDSRSGGALIANATSVDGAAGIGGEDSGTVGSITIQGGTVTATGGTGAAGIGGGYENGSVGPIVITAGIITAKAGQLGANAIGNGDGSSYAGGSISISGGSVYVDGTINKNWSVSCTGGAFIRTQNSYSDFSSASWSGVVVLFELSDGSGVYYGRLYGGDVTLTTDVIIDSNMTLVVGAGQTLTVSGVSLVNNGRIQVDGRISTANGGTIRGNDVLYKVTKEITNSYSAQVSVGFESSIVPDYLPAGAGTLAGWLSDTENYGPIFHVRKTLGGESVDVTMSQENLRQATFTMPAEPVTVTMEILPCVPKSNPTLYFYASDAIADIDLSAYVNVSSPTITARDASSLPDWLTFNESAGTLSATGTYGGDSVPNNVYRLYFILNKDRYAPNLLTVTLRTNTPAFTVTIPESVSFDGDSGTGTVTAEGVKLGSTLAVQVELTASANSFQLRDQDSTVSYTVNAGGEVVGADGVLLKVPIETSDNTRQNGGTAGSGSQTLAFTPTDHAYYSGSYEDTLTFTVKVVSR